jgi:hypothetical protein
MREVSKSQDRLTTHDVNRTQLPRPEAPSSFAHRRSLWRMRGRCNTTHDQVALANSRVFARDRRLCVIRIAGAASAPDHAALLPAFDPEELNGSLPSAPSQPQGGASLRSRWPSSRVRTDARWLSCESVTRAGRERKRVEDAAGRTRTCAVGGEPRLVVSRTPPCHPAGPQRVGTTRYVLTMGRRPARSAAGRALRCAAASVTRPAKGEILVTDRGAFRPSDRPPRVGAK